MKCLMLFSWLIQKNQRNLSILCLHRQVFKMLIHTVVKLLIYYPFQWKGNKLSSQVVKTTSCVLLSFRLIRPNLKNSWNIQLQDTILLRFKKAVIPTLFVRLTMVNFLDGIWVQMHLMKLSDTPWESVLNQYTNTNLTSSLAITVAKYKLEI